ncbi:MAG: hypothetical protein WKF78_01220 [Candidatus Limnocylindrales bacterium]
MDRTLPADAGGAALPSEWALQDPDDYLQVFRTTIPEILRASAVAPHDVIGVGIDFTACTMLPVTADGTPLCNVPEFRGERHAWVKLWKHHAAQPQADRINQVARDRDEPWLARYGERISSEWFFAKALQILEEAPHVYQRADRLIEAADWVVWRLTGEERRTVCTAGYKAMWSGPQASRRTTTSGPCIPTSPTSSTRRCRASCTTWASGPEDSPMKPRPGPGCCPAPPSPSPTWMPTWPSPRRRSSNPIAWS